MKKIYLCLFLLFALNSAQADEQLVEMEKPTEYFENINLRRDEFGLQVNINLIKYNYKNFLSSTDSYNIGEAISTKNSLTINPELLFKINYYFGSIIVGMGYSLLNTKYASDRNINIQGYDGSIGIELNNLNSLDMLVPFIHLQLNNLRIEESISDAINHHNIENILVYKLGLNIDISSIDDNSSRTSYVNNGLKNTFLSLFVQSNSQPKDEIYSLESEIHYGIGLNWEF